MACPEYQTMDKAQKLNGLECNTPSSEFFQIGETANSIGMISDVQQEAAVQHYVEGYPYIIPLDYQLFNHPFLPSRFKMQIF
jgi:hypothetical protein